MPEPLFGRPAGQTEIGMFVADVDWTMSGAECLLVHGKARRIPAQTANQNRGDRRTWLTRSSEVRIMRLIR